MASDGVFVRPGEVPDGEEGQHIVDHSKPTPWRPDALEGTSSARWERAGAPLWEGSHVFGREFQLPTP